MSPGCRYSLGLPKRLDVLLSGYRILGKPRLTWQPNLQRRECLRPYRRIALRAPPEGNIGTMGVGAPGFDKQTCAFRAANELQILLPANSLFCEVTERWKPVSLKSDVCLSTSDHCWCTVPLECSEYRRSWPHPPLSKGSICYPDQL
ncbi:hypothetical protein EVAR_73024_1 [Eumeta japonica]|uniref:Uncharacterized protein n=1 Tax=Eumeta variegata TaxID=151549 RepID=A0A4C1TQ17_EUMVA|nr:hypothetical protein EVAR_73024_1 [Eumeta japonica]